jgi:hypothetical protein
LDTNTGNNYNRYLVSFTLPHRIPKGGLIRLSFPTSGFSSNPTAAGFEILSGTYTGTPVMSFLISAPNFYIDL